MKQTKQLSHWVVAYLPPVIWAGTIFFLSAQSVLPSITVSGFDFVFKKVAHITVYAVLYVLLHRANSITRPNATNSSTWLIPAAVAVLYALTDEFHQSIVPGRSATIRDIGYDSLGIFVAFLWQYRYI